MAVIAIPEKVIVVFPAGACMFGRKIPPDYKVEVTARQCGYKNPTMKTTKVIRDSLMAVFAGMDTTPSNSDELNALALVLAKSFYQSMDVQYDFVVNGLADWQPEGMTDVVEFTYTGKDFTTRIHRNIQDFPDSFDHEDRTCCPKDMRITNIICKDKIRKVYGRVLEYANSRLYKVSREEYMYDAGCCQCYGYICMDAVGCHNDPVSASYSFTTQAGGESITPKSSYQDGDKTCFKLPLGDYDIEVSAPGYVTQTTGVKVIEDITGSKHFVMVPTSTEIKVCMYVYGCGVVWFPGMTPPLLPDGSGGRGTSYPIPASIRDVPLQGATVDFGGAFTGTTDAEGKVCYTFMNTTGVKAFVVSAENYKTSTYNVNIVGSCGSYNLALVMNVADDRRCCGDANLPISWNLSYGGGTDVVSDAGGNWRRVVGVPDAYMADVCSTPYSCPDRITGLIAMGIQFQCNVDQLTNKFTGFHWNVTYQIAVCAPNNVGSSSVPICDDGHYYYNCCSGIGGLTFPLSCTTCANSCPPLAGTTRNILGSSNVFESGDVLRSSMSESPWDGVIVLSGKTIDCTRPGAPSNPFYVPPIVPSISITE